MHSRVREIRLYQFAPDEGIESASSFCIKVQRALRLKGLAYAVENVNPANISKISPETKKLPVLEVDGKRLWDSSRILQAIDLLAPEPSLYPASSELHALNHLLEDWADESLYWFTVHQRWVVDAHFAAFAKGAFGRMPIPLKWLVPPIARRTAVSQVVSQGLGRLSPAEVSRRLDDHLAALNVRLAGGGFLIDDHVRAADIAVFAILRSMMVPYMTDVRARIESHPSLNKWILRVDEVTRPEKAAALAA